MRVIRIAAVALMAAGVFADRPAWSQQTVDFTGRVFDQKTNRGIENLEVRFTPPRQSNLVARVASTDANGVFAFRQLARSRYLVEVSQNVHLLYRAEVDATSQTHVDIPLQRTR